MEILQSGSLLWRLCRNKQKWYNHSSQSCVMSTSTHSISLRSLIWSSKRGEGAVPPNSVWKSVFQYSDFMTIFRNYLCDQLCIEYFKLRFSNKWNILTSRFVTEIVNGIWGEGRKMNIMRFILHNTTKMNVCMISKEVAETLW